MAFNALLDACVLYPVGVRDLLLSVAERRVYAPHWTEAILDEMARNVIEDGRATAERLALMRTQMQLAFPDATVEGYEQLIPAMTNDDKDRHVLAAAVRCGAGVIVTDNIRDFPAAACDPFDIEVQTADEFLSYAVDHDPSAVIAAIHTMAQKRRRPPATVAELVGALGARLPEFTTAVSAVLDTF